MGSPYPAPELFFEGDAFDQEAIADAAQQSGSPRAHASIQTDTIQLCRAFNSEAVTWDFGDGEKLGTISSTGTVDNVVPHVYDAIGDKRVTMVARRFYFDLSKFPADQDSEEFLRAAYDAFTASREELEEQGILKSYLVSTATTVHVLVEDCDGIAIRGIPLKTYTVIGANLADPLGPGVAEDCFLGFKAEGSSKTLWRPVPGTMVSLNGITLTPPPGDDIVVDTQGATIGTLNGGTIDLTYWTHTSSYGYGGKVTAGSTPQIVIPPLQQDAELGRQVATLPSFGGYLGQEKLYGFEPAGAQLMLSPDVSAIARLSFKPLPPLNGATPILILGGLPTRARQAGDADFSMDLSDINIGPFRTKNFTIAHHPGEWQGGGKFLLDLGATSYELNASYIPPGSGYDDGEIGGRCRDLGENEGPSGLSIADDGGLNFAGGAIRGTLATIGPIEINCLGAAFNKDPFILIGTLGATLPPKTDVLGLDVCVKVAILEDNQQAPGCGAGYIARDGHEVYVMGRGTVTLLGELPLAQAGFDVHAGSDLFKVSAFGQVYLEAGPFYVRGRVGGTIITEPEEREGFEFTGELELGAGPVSVGAIAIVSSKGIGACVDAILISGGFVYRWHGGLDVFAGCGWGKFSDIRVQRRMVQRTDLRAPIGTSEPLAHTSAADVSVDAGRAVSFQVEGVNAPPRITVTAPDGTKVTAPAYDPNHPYKEVNGVGFLTIPKITAPVRKDYTRLGGTVPPQVIVTVENPKAGTYALDPQAGSEPIAQVMSSTKLDQRRITGRLTGTGARRKLSYYIKPIPGQSVEFVEESPEDTRRTVGRPGVGRTLGVVEPGARAQGTIRLPEGYGPAGPREIWAIVSQEGDPVDRIRVARYTAPTPPRIVPPSGLKLTRSRTGTLRACWTAVSDARFYEITVTAGDGRKLLARPTKTCAEFPGFDESVGASVAVRTVTAWGSSTRMAQTKLRAKATKLPGLRF